MPESAGSRELESIPGVGPSLAADLRDLGYEQVADLVGQDPGAMFERLGLLRRARQDPCVLYVFRCAVYFASTADPDPELLRWWAWKDGVRARPATPCRSGSRPPTSRRRQADP